MQKIQHYRRPILNKPMTSTERARDIHSRMMKAAMNRGVREVGSLDVLAQAIDALVEEAVQIMENYHKQKGVHEHDCYQMKHDLAKFVKDHFNLPLKEKG